MRKQSPQTQLRELKHTLAECQNAKAEAMREAYAYRQRATKAEQEVAEWKHRFDALLSRTPEVSK